MSIVQPLTAGALLQFDFPKLPETLYAMTVREEKPVARLQVCLPANYTAEGSFPLWVHLHGGTAGPGAAWEIDYVRRLTGNADFIGVTLPLFKKAFDPQEIFGGILIRAFDDYPVIAECYRVMFSTLFQAIPNIAPGQGTMGGFSNGAHTTAMLLSAVDPFILEHFNNFYLLDGGFTITSRYKPVIAGKNILAMIGGSRKDKRRRLNIQLMNAKAQAAKEEHRNFHLIKMPDVEHDFPDEYIGTLQNWVRKMAQQGLMSVNYSFAELLARAEEPS